MDVKNNFISVIIPTLKRESINAVLEALNKQSRKPDEVIVVEDLYKESAGVVRNKGIEKCKGNLIAFLDDDTIPPEDWLEKFEKQIIEYDADGISGNYIETDPFLHEIRMTRKFPNHTIVNPDGYFGIGGNVMYTLSCFEKSKKAFGFVFDPSFRNTSEDIDLALRLRVLGCRLVYTTNHVIHLKKVNFKSYLKTQFSRGRGLYDLYLSSMKYKKEKILGNSLLWDSKNHISSTKKWRSVFFYRIIGPFNREDFSSLKYFLMFWMGEKVKSLGFACQAITSKFKT